MNDQTKIVKDMNERPHLFILGAGATKATIPNGDKNGLTSPTMDNFLSEIGLIKLLKDINLKTKSNNVEDIYTELTERSDCKYLVEKLEEGIIDHYTKMVIPDEPTLYDYLLLSLRKKDCVATFNWDPLLIQAYNRVNKITTELPEMLFLHSCVEAGLCESCQRYGPLRNKRCSQCGGKLKMPKLLFPIREKNYHQNIFIEHNWTEFEYYVQQATLITIWGYSAPKSDVEAKKLMYTAFSKQFRKLDQIEIIDIANENDLLDTWAPFIHQTNYHISIYNSLLDSLIGKFPRRSTEGYTKVNIEGWWEESSLRSKKCSSFDELKTLFTPLIYDEEKNNIKVI